MKITELIINNYKSMGNERNILKLEQGTTAIIGKNESGKSNVLEAIGNLPYLNKSNQFYFQNNKNRKIHTEEISVVIKMHFEEQEAKKLNANVRETTFTFTTISTVAFSGALSELIERDHQLWRNIEKLNQTMGNRKIWNIGSETNKKQCDIYLKDLQKCSNIIRLNFYHDIEKLKRLLLTTGESYEELTNVIEEVEKTLSEYYSLMPKIHYRPKDLYLEYSYNHEKVKESIKSKTDIFNRLMLAADIDKTEMLRAFTERNEGERQNIQLKIEEKLSKNIGERFNQFYKQEEVKFNPRFRDKELKFIVSTNDGEAMMVTERSNGLKWYLSLFIDILANDIVEDNVLFLFDEPGVYLHVNAQKELLNLFDDLCEKDNQVMYTTHSPSMIDGENLFNIRVVDKNKDGNTLISENYSDPRLSTESKMETLSPLIKAIGADMKFNIGPQFHKLNIITEGIIDSMYIKAFLKHFNINDYPNIIPAAGVDNINRVASILLGWGCEFKILLDYDMQGRKEFEVLTNRLDLTTDNIVFANGENIAEKERMKNTPIEIEDLISQKDFGKLVNKIGCDEKKIVAKEFLDKITQGQIKPEYESEEAFKVIFNQLNIILDREKLS